MKYEITRELDHNYLSIEQTLDKEGEYELNIILGNKIKGLLPVTYNMFNGQGKFKYEISGFMSMEKLFPYQSLNLGDIKLIINGIVGVLDIVKDSLLSKDSIILEPENIYINQNEVYFCYLPSYHANLSEGFKNLSQFMLNHIDYQDEASVKAIYDINRRIMCEELNIYELANCLDSYDANKKAVVPNTELKDMRQIDLQSANIENEAYFNIEKANEDLARDVEKIFNEKADMEEYNQNIEYMDNKVFFEKKKNNKNNNISLAAQRFYEDGKYEKKQENREEIKIRNNSNLTKVVPILMVMTVAFIICTVFLMRNGGNILQIIASLAVCLVLGMYAIERQVHILKKVKDKVSMLREMGEDMEMIGWTEEC